MISTISERSFLNKVVVITGADSGLGRVFTERFAESEACLALVMQSKDFDEVQEFIVSNKLETRARIFVADLTEQGAVDTTTRSIIDHFKRIDILINNAGMRQKKTIFEVDETDWDASVSINMKVPFFFTQRVAELMIKLGINGSIINISSQLGLVAARDYSIYCISKAGLISLTKALAIELARYNISVNSVAPGPTNTFNASLLRDENDVVDFLQRMPIARRVEPSEVADAVEYLARNPGGAVTGHTLVVDGGWTIW
jgi:NAD(P)-dependent dehydrogenase (short-subunit alcohol dehydrogenase family)